MPHQYLGHPQKIRSALNALKFDKPGYIHAVVSQPFTPAVVLTRRGPAPFVRQIVLQGND